MSAAIVTVAAVIASSLVVGSVALGHRPRGPGTDPRAPLTSRELARGLCHVALGTSLSVLAALTLGLSQTDLLDIYRGRATPWQCIGVGVLVVLVCGMLIAEAVAAWRSAQARRRCRKRA